jgi:hypothetical protein
MNLLSLQKSQVKSQIWSPQTYRLRMWYCAAWPELLFFYCYLWGGTKSLGTAATSDLLYKSQMIDEGDCGAIGGMKIGKGNRSTERKPAPAPLCPLQIPHDQTRARTPDRRGGKAATNRLSYGAAHGQNYLTPRGVVV